MALFSLPRETSREWIPYQSSRSEIQLILFVSLIGVVGDEGHWGSAVYGVGLIEGGTIDLGIRVCNRLIAVPNMTVISLASASN